jgi:hypothetical protein
LQNRGETIYGSAFALKKDKAQQINDLLRSYPHRNKINFCQQLKRATLTGLPFEVFRAALCYLFLNAYS